MFGQIVDQPERFGAIGDGEHQVALTAGKEFGAAFSRCLDGAVATMDTGGKKKGKSSILQVHIRARSIAAWSMPLVSCAAHHMETELLLQWTASSGDS